MSIWIRNQDKKLLIKCDNFSIECYMKAKCFDIETIEIPTKTHTTLGTYSTEEKALKVLDMIQETIIQNETVYAHDFSGSGVRDYDIFQMPADESL